MTLFKFRQLCEALVGKTTASLTDAELVLYNILSSDDSTVMARNMLSEDNGIVVYGTFWDEEGIDWSE